MVIDKPRAPLTGNASIDAEHLKIFDLGAEFREAPTPKLARDIIATILVHLSSEEQTMYAIDLEEAVLHAASHNIFRRQLAEILNNIDRNFPETVAAIDDAVFGWFKSHAASSDALFTRGHTDTKKPSSH